MASPELLSAPVVFEIGGLAITRTVVTTWGIMLALAFASWIATRRLALRPGTLQAALEGVVSAIEDAVRAVLPDQARQVMPLIATLWIYILVANLISVIPALRSPTDDLSQTAALAVLVFFAVHGFGIRVQGLKGYLRHYLAPNPLFLPFHVLGEFTRTVALTARLAGNIMSLETAALLVLLVAGFLAPVPVLMLHIVEAVVQAYIFGMLALIYVAGGIQAQQIKQERTEP
jgi:F-type H+-transporting ATPase subunit a